MFQCAYCNFFEKHHIQGYKDFWVEHRKPKGRDEFKHLECEYSNLYYACYPCNKTKRTQYPTLEQERAGTTFIDPCKVDPYEQDFRIEKDGKLTPLTPAGDYSIRILGLNSDSCVNYRKMRLDAQSALEETRDGIQKWERIYRNIWFFYATDEVRKTLESLRNLENHLHTRWIDPTPPYPSELSKLKSGSRNSSD